MQENKRVIGCAIEKGNPENMSKMSSEFIRIEEFDLDIAHTITTKEPSIYVQHSNIILEIERLTSNESEIRIPESRAEQSRAA